VTMAFFETWSFPRVKCLAFKLSSMCTLGGDGFAGLPCSAENSEFWKQATALVNEPKIFAKEDKVTTAELEVATTVELDSIDITKVSLGLFLCSTSSAKSRLARAMLNIGGVLAVDDEEDVKASERCVSINSPTFRWETSDIDQLQTYEAFGEVSTRLINPSVSLVEQLPRAINFMYGLTAPVLICSTSGNGLAAALAAAFLASQQGLTPKMAIEMVEKRRGPLRIEYEHEEALAVFCQKLLQTEMILLLGAPSGSTSFSLSTPPITPTKRRLPDEPLSLSPIKKGAAAPKASPCSSAKMNSKKSRAALDCWRLDR